MNEATETIVRRLEINGRQLDDQAMRQEFEEAAIISFLWFVFLGVGLSSGITGADSLPTLGKITFVFNMWTGRLEIIPVLVTLQTIFSYRGLYR